MPTLVVLAVLFILFQFFTGIWTDVLWYRSVGFSQVFTTQLTTRLILFFLFGLLMAGAIVANVLIGYRVRPTFRGSSLEQQSLDRYRMAIDPYRKLIVGGVAVFLGLIAGSSASGEWRTWLQWRNATSFGVQDPQFHRDISFYVFTYPWLRFLLGFLFAIVILSLIAAAVTHYLYGGIRTQGPGDRVSTAAQAHLSVLLGLFVLLKAVAYWLDRYGLAIHGDERFRGWTGLRYTDANAMLPAKTILAVIAFICAVLFFANLVRRTWLLPGIGFGLLVLCAILIGGVYPAVVQQFKVKPSERDLESPFIARNIVATRQAYGIDNAEVQDYNASTNLTQAQLRDDTESTASVRLLDPAIISPTFQQLQQVRGYYGFPPSLDVDRYRIDGKLQDSVVSVRELNLSGVPSDQRGWINDHLVYTHGFGMVTALGNTRDSAGRPIFTESNIPPTGDLGTYEPRIYFGEQSPNYSIVGAPAGRADTELDYPDDTSGTGQRNTTYQGDGGVRLGNWFNKLLYAVKFREMKIFLSSDVNPDSRILYFRQPRERIERVAPWLTLDSDAYPAVVNGRVLWIVDGYTTTSGYPYSARTTLGEATQDTLTTSQRAVIAPQNQVNYIRNSVKATVDAFDGTVTLYAWDEGDPVLRTWMKAFPDSVRPRSEITPDLMAHLRYPQDLFKVQRDLISHYHVTDPGSFFSGQDFWRVPTDPTLGADTGRDQPPYYLTIKMPGQTEGAFSLTSTLVPVNRVNLAAFMAVDATPGEDYGKIRVLQLPRNTAIPGPGQAQNSFRSDPTITSALSLLTRGGQSIVEFGNLLTLPVGGGLLYVEPVYVKAASGTSFPLLQKVIVGFGDKVAMANTLDDALAALFTGEGPTQPPPEEPGTPTTPPTQPPGGGGTISPELAAALQDAQQAYAAGQAALAQNPPDWAAFGQAQNELRQALDRIAQLSGAGGSAPPATPTGSASPPT